MLTPVLSSLTARETFNVFPYFKNPAACKKLLLTVASGLPKICLRSSSELTVISSSTGPHLNVPAKPPIEVDRAGMTFVRSISLTSTPGDTKNPVFFSSFSVN